MIFGTRCLGIRLVIATDNDAEGEGAAARLARRCRKWSIPALVVVPENDDFNVSGARTPYLGRG